MQITNIKQAIYSNSRQNFNKTAQPNFTSTFKYEGRIGPNSCKYKSKTYYDIYTCIPDTGETKGSMFAAIKKFGKEAVKLLPDNNDYDSFCVLINYPLENALLKDTVYFDKKYN